MLLVVGAMDAESHADVLAYARGLAESQVIAKDACFIDVVSHNGRKIFEVQEGGLGRSITAWALQLLETEPGARVDVPLTEFRVASIRQTGTDLITVIHPPDEIRHAKAAEGIGSLFLGKPLAPFYGTARAIRSAMTALLVTSAVVFSVAGGVFPQRVGP